MTDITNNKPAEDTEGTPVNGRTISSDIIEADLMSQQQSLPSVRRKIRYSSLDPDLARAILDIPQPAQIANTAIFGAAASIEIDPDHLRAVSDPYSNKTRKEFTAVVYEDPIMSPAFERRHDAIFEDGLQITLELKTQYDAQTGTKLTDEEAMLALELHSAPYLQHLQRIRTWAREINLEATMAKDAMTSIPHGRSVSLIIPELSALGPGMMPLNVIPVNWEDLGEPVVDTVITHKIVALLTSIPNRRTILPDGMVYTVRKDWGIRKESERWGSSSFEPILKLSQIVKRLYNYNIPQAIIASYMTKVLFRFSGLAGVTDEDIKDRMNAVIKGFLSNNIAHGVTDDIEILPVNQRVDSQMLDINEKKLADLLLAIIGVPKSMMNREHNLNRDIATIEAIQFLKFVRKADENLVIESYEQQLLTPLLAHLAGVDIDMLPVRVKIKSNTQDIIDNLEEQKKEEIQTEQITQEPGAAFGAATSSPPAYFGLQRAPKVTTATEKKNEAESALDKSEKILDQIIVNCQDRLTPFAAKYLKTKMSQQEFEDRHDAEISLILHQCVQQAYITGADYVQEKTGAPAILAEADITAITDMYTEAKSIFWARLQNLKNKKQAERIEKRQGTLGAAAKGEKEEEEDEEPAADEELVQTAVLFTLLSNSVTMAVNQATLTLAGRQQQLLPRPPPTGITTTTFPTRPPLLPLPPGQYKTTGVSAPPAISFQFKTQKDDRVCPICAPLEGVIMSARKNNVEQPPLHDACRCRLDIYNKAPANYMVYP